jgi:hypothetical protein
MIDEFNVIEFHDKFQEGVISPHDYYITKYKYKDIVFVYSSLYDSHLGSSMSCDIFAPTVRYEFDKVFYDSEDITDDINEIGTEVNKYDYDKMEFTQKEKVRQDKICEIWTQDTQGFGYRWIDFYNKYREEIEKLLFETEIPKDIIDKVYKEEVKIYFGIDL